MGNGYCNDETNNLECNYDGGDCCLGSGLDTQYCTECQCLYGDGEGIFYTAYFQGCQKSDFSQIKLSSSCSKIDPKSQKLQIYLKILEYSAMWGQS